MQSQLFEKEVTSIINPQKFFKVRKVTNLANNNQHRHTPIIPSIKQNLSFLKTQNHQYPIDKFASSDKKMQKNHLLLTVPSQGLKELQKKYHNLKKELQIQKKLSSQKLKEKQQELTKIQKQNEQLQTQKQTLEQRRTHIKQKIQAIRLTNQLLKKQYENRQQEMRMMELQNMQNIILGMQYQNGVQIDPDNMTYQELLELQEQIGSVSKGLNQKQLALLRKKQAEGRQQQLCSICYSHPKQGEEVHQLTCGHLFHVECIRQWLLQQRVCPLCKQQAIVIHEDIDEPQTNDKL